MYIDSTSAEKIQLGMGECFDVLRTAGTYTASGQDYWGFLEIQPDTEINGLIFTPDNTAISPIVVTRYDGVNVGVLLIPPVYAQLIGSWTSVTLANSSGQVNCYGKNPLG